MDLDPFFPTLDHEIVRVVVSLVVVVVLTWLLLRLSQGLVHRLIEGAMRTREAEDTRGQLTLAEALKRRRTLEALGGNLARFAIVVVAGIAVLGIFNVDLGPVIAGLGLLGLGVGLGLQNLVRDIVSGAFVLIENQYATGDVVKIADVSGTVEELGLRRTVLRDADGTVHVVPNGLIQVASNQTRAWARILVDVPIKDPADLDRAVSAAQSAADAMVAESDWKRWFLDTPRVSGVQAMAGTGIVLQASAMVVAVHRPPAAAELRRRIVAEFAAQKIPFGELPVGWVAAR